MSIEIADVLDRAADYIDEHGWYQGDYANNEGAVCLFGAVNSVTNSLAAARVCSDLSIKVHTALFKVNPFMATWNDEPGRTQDEVTGLLRTVAARERGQG